MRLAPLPVTRAANAAIGILVVVTGLGLITDAGLPNLVHGLGVILILVGVALAVRGWRLCVICDQGEVEIRGLLRNRTISRSRITELTDFPALRWHRAGGRVGWTPIVALMGTGRALAFVSRHNDEQLRRLGRWLKAER